MKNTNRQFRKTEVQIPKLDTVSKKNRKAVLILKVSLLFFILSFMLYGIYTFFTTFTFQSPIILQNPLIRISHNLQDPTSSRSASIIGVANAQEVKNPFDIKSPKGVAWDKNKSKFGIVEWGALEELIMNESAWNPYSINRSSGACGLGQSLPCSKMNCQEWDFDCQADWVLNYIETRYQTPTKALEFWNTLHLINGEMVHYY